MSHEGVIEFKYDGNVYKFSKNKSCSFCAKLFVFKNKKLMIKTTGGWDTLQFKQIKVVEYDFYV